MTYIDRFELHVGRALEEDVVEQWLSFPHAAGAVHVWPHDDLWVKVEIWGEAAQDALYWYMARTEEKWFRPMRVDVKQDLPAEVMDEEELRSVGISLMQDPRIRARISIQEQDRSGDKGTTMVTVGAYSSAKSLAVYGRGDGWRIETRLRADAARLFIGTLMEAKEPERTALDAIERVQWDLCREVIWPVGGKPLDLQLSRKGQKRTQYTPSERIRRNTKGIILLAEKYGLWDTLAASIPEIYTALHLRAQQEQRWDQATLEDARFDNVPLGDDDPA